MTLYTPVVLSDLGDAYDVAVRSQVDPASLSESVRMIVTAMDPELPLYSASSLQAKLASSISSRQFNAVVLSIFAGLALVLAAVGIFGVLSFNVVQRTREMGIRLALGAEPRNLLKLLIFEEMKVVFLGIAVGTFAAIAATPLARSFLFEVNATDPATFLIAAITLGAIGSTTCYMTARRVLKVDPVRTLRYQ
jgi:putative ABC transport system permease protein